MRRYFVKLGKEAAIYGFGRALGRFIAIFLVPIYTRIFNPEQYGIIELIGVSFTFLGLFLNLGLDTAMFFYFNEEKSELERKKTLGTVLILKIGTNILVSLILILVAHKFSNFLFNSVEYRIFIVLAAITLIFTNISSYFSNVFRINHQPWRYMYISVTNVIISVIISITLVVILKMGLFGAYLASLSTAIIIFILSFILGNKYISFKFSLSRLIELLKYGLPLIPGSISIWVMNAGNRYFINNYLDLNQLGLYSIGFRIASIVTFFAFAVRMALGPAIYDIAKKDEALEIYSKLFILYSTFFYFLILLVSIFGREILTVLTTEQFIPGESVIFYLAVSAAAFGMAQITSIGLAITKKTIHMSWPIMVGAVIALILNILLIPRFGIIGAAIATMVSLIVINIIQYKFSQKFYPIPFQIKKFLLLSMGVLGIYILSSCFDEITLINEFAKVILLGSFFLLVYYLKIVGKNEVMILLNKK